MKTFYLCLSTCLFVFSSFAQQWDWAADLGEVGASQFPTLVTTNGSGDLFTASIYDSDLYEYYTVVSRRNNAGNVSWTRTIGGTNNQHNFTKDISIDSDNNIYITGFYFNNLIFAGDTITSTDWQVFILSIDPTGNERWIKSLPYNSNLGNAIANDNNDNLIYVNTNPNDSTWNIIKLSQNGVEMWNKTDSSNGMVSDIIIDSNNNPYIYGTFSGEEFKINQTTYFQDTGYFQSSFIAKLNTSGDIQDVEIIPGGFQLIVDMDAQNNLYMTGAFVNRMMFCHYTFEVDTCIDNNCIDYFMGKLNQINSCTWVWQMEDNFIQGGMTVSDEGEIFITGSFRDSLIFDTISIYEPVSRNAAFIFKFNKDGEAQWAQKNEGTYLADSFVSDITFSETNDIYISGDFHTNLSFGSQIWFGNDTLPDTGFKTHLYIAKMQDNQIITSAGDKIEFAKNLNIYPNPSDGLLFITDLAVNSEIKIYDLLGNLVFKKSNEGNTRTTIDLNGKPGVYFVQISTEGKIATRKIVVK